jgi:primosomal protein N' (replication factor Y)
MSLIMSDLIQVALPLPMDRPFTYRIPESASAYAQPGCRAVVPFGKQLLVGVIVDIPSEKIEASQIRTVQDLPDAEPVLLPEIIELCRWISLYYYCSWGEALKAALPSGHLKPALGTPLRWQEVITLGDEVTPTRLSEKAAEIEKKAPQQARILNFLSLQPRQWVASDLLSGAAAGRSALKALLQLELLKSRHIRLKRYPSIEALTARDEAPLPEPNWDQQTAIQAISTSLKAGQQKTFLLYGVTGSGKTLVYQKAIEAALELNGSALVLVPEISLTPQMVGRFRAQFGDRVGLQHSAMSAGERLDVWQGIRAGEFPVVLGARSAVFAPLQNLKLIVVDEEGDSSFKQNEPNPRYHARDVALVRAQMASACAILGSATPSLESFFNAETKRYAILELPQRVDGVPPPILRLTSPARSPSKTIGMDLERAILSRLQRKEQVILLQNRRGFHTYIFCPKCGHIQRCRHCEITLTLHQPKSRPELRCHFCGYRAPPASSCPKCGQALRSRGAGTQRVEDELAEMMPPERIVRLDLDTTSRKGSHHRILKGFAAGDYDVMVGTKMVARGHDYPRVTLVGVVSADTDLAFPDFRCDERAFVQLLQAAGRAGRSAAQESPGEVIIQTWMPGHPVLKLVKEGDYLAFYNREIALRRSLGYPPLGWMILLAFSSRKEEKALKSAQDFIKLLSQADLKGIEALGPSAAYRPRLKDKYRFQVILKASRRARSLESPLHQKLRQAINRFRTEIPSSVHFVVDVDPIQLL